jgi:hypothetical protein
MSTCKVDGCGKAAVSNISGLCQMHYKRLKKHGTTEMPKGGRGPIEQRFWLYVDKRGPDDCWEWNGALGPNGYGRVSTKKNPDMIASRVSYELTKGEIPKGRVVMHSCDNRKCVNPAHLSVGTYLDNMRDMIEKCRSVHNPMRGSKHPRCKLSEIDVLSIRASNESSGVLANRYGVSKSTIDHIRLRITWRHI